jgi:hypothetical protein
MLNSSLTTEFVTTSNSGAVFANTIAMLARSWRYLPFGV